MKPLASRGSGVASSVDTSFPGGSPAEKAAREARFKTMSEMNSQCYKILGPAVERASPKGKQRLQGAYEYLMAAMLADFILEAERPSCIGPLVGNDKSMKPTREFLIDLLFLKWLRRLYSEPGGEDYLLAVRARLTKILTDRPAAGERPRTPDPEGLVANPNAPDQPTDSEVKK